MAKTRLNMHHRDALRRFADQNIACPKEDATNTKTYELASKLVREAAEKKYPPSDMAVLEKYSTAGRDTCINGGNPAGVFMRFEFTADDHAPIMPNHYCGSRSISFNQKTSDAIDAYHKAKTALETARREKLTKYRSLIETARYFEEVLDVWPAASALADRITPRTTALVTLSDDVKTFIKTDNAGEQLAA